MTPAVSASDVHSIKMRILWLKILLTNKFMNQLRPGISSGSYYIYFRLELLIQPIRLNQGFGYDGDQSSQLQQIIYL